MAFTYFFRDKSTLDLISEIVIPELRALRSIDIWDAGCAMGPEPYSLAIILRENMGRFIFRNLTINATDIDTGNQFDDIITSGLYPLEQIQRIPDHIREKYFMKDSKSGLYLISDELRRAVVFKQHDLLTLEPVKTGLGLVMCKNVLMHFREQERVAVLRMFHSALHNRGFLVMEQTQPLPAEVSHLFEPAVPHAKIFRKVAGS